MRISSALIGLAAAIVVASLMIIFTPQPAAGTSPYWFGVTGTLAIEVASGMILFIVSKVADEIANDIEAENELAAKRAQAQLEFTIAEAVKKALAV